MYTYRFIGKIEPENLIEDFNLKSEIHLQQIEFGIKGVLDIIIEREKIEVLYISEIDHTLETSANLETVKNSILDTVELLTNLYGFVHSIYLDVYILYVKCEELNIEHTFGIKGERNISKTSFEASQEFNKLFSIFTDQSNSNLKEVFSDFHKALKYPAMSAQFCFRAIEIIRQNYYENSLCNDDKKRRSEGWDLLRKELNYEINDFRLIQNYGIPNRHGNYPAITYDVRLQIMNFTRELIEKFIGIKLDVK